MRLLLDTHVWLWAMMEPERLNAVARHSIEREAELILSVASILEMAIKQASGKLRIEGCPGPPFLNGHAAALSSTMGRCFLPSR